MVNLKSGECGNNLKRIGHGHNVYFCFSIVLLVVVKEFFGTKLVSSGEESLADLFRRYLSLGYEKTVSVYDMFILFGLFLFYFVFCFSLVLIYF